MHLSKPANYFVVVALAVKTIAITIFPLLAAIFIYVMLSDPTGIDLKEPREVSFNALKLSPDDKNSINFIVENLAKKGKSELLMMSYKLNAQGNKINDIHPLRFISYILSDEKMKKDYLPLILNDRFKKASFMKGLTKKLESVNNKNLLKLYLVDFMKSTRIPLSKKGQLESFINEKKWQDFFNFAVKNSRKPSLLF